MSPLRLHTALSLYSSNLSALVLLVDDRVNSLTGNKERESSTVHWSARDTSLLQSPSAASLVEFAEICRQSTDFHFADIDSQLEGVREQAALVREKREMFGGLDPDSVDSPSSNSATTLSRTMSGSAMSDGTASCDADLLQQGSGVASGTQTPSLLPAQLPVRFTLNDSFSADASAVCLQPGVWVWPIVLGAGVQ